jgi:hypothetical protein
MAKKQQLTYLEIICGLAAISPGIIPGCHLCAAHMTLLFNITR